MGESITALEACPLGNEYLSTLKSWPVANLIETCFGLVLLKLNFRNAIIKTSNTKAFNFETKCQDLTFIKL